jgi:hypothetical protein
MEQTTPEKGARPGARATEPLHVLQMLAATALLVISAILLIKNQHLFGVLALAAGGVLSFVNLRGR